MNTVYFLFIFCISLTKTIIASNNYCPVYIKASQNLINKNSDTIKNGLVENIEADKFYSTDFKLDKKIFEPKTETLDNAEYNNLEYNIAVLATSLGIISSFKASCEFDSSNNSIKIEYGKSTNTINRDIGYIDTTGIKYLTQYYDLFIVEILKKGFRFFFIKDRIKLKTQGNINYVTNNDAFSKELQSNSVVDKINNILIKSNSIIPKVNYKFSYINSKKNDSAEVIVIDERESNNPKPKINQKSISFFGYPTLGLMLASFVSFIKYSLRRENSSASPENDSLKTNNE